MGERDGGWEKEKEQDRDKKRWQKREGEGGREKEEKDEAEKEEERRDWEEANSQPDVHELQRGCGAQRREEPLLPGETEHACKVLAECLALS